MPNAILINATMSNMICNIGGEYMAFQIKSDRKETETKSIRFPVELTEKIEKAIMGNDVSFSGFVIQACEYALDNMKKD